MVVVDDLDEGLDLRSLSNLLLVHATSDLQGVTLDTGNNGVTIWSFLGALVVVYVARKKKRNVRMQGHGCSSIPEFCCAKYA